MKGRLPLFYGSARHTSARCSSNHLSVIVLSGAGSEFTITAPDGLMTAAPVVGTDTKQFGALLEPPPEVDELLPPHPGRLMISTLVSVATAITARLPIVRRNAVMQTLRMRSPAAREPRLFHPPEVSSIPANAGPRRCIIALLFDARAALN